MQHARPLVFLVLPDADKTDADLALDVPVLEQTIDDVCDLFGCIDSHDPLDAALPYPDAFDTVAATWVDEMVFTDQQPILALEPVTIDETK